MLNKKIKQFQKRIEDLEEENKKLRGMLENVISNMQYYSEQTEENERMKGMLKNLISNMQYYIDKFNEIL